jgi:hypothetical protein
MSTTNSSKKVSFGTNSTGLSSGISSGQQTGSEYMDAVKNRSNEATRERLFGHTGDIRAFTNTKQNTPESQQGRLEAMSGEEALNTIRNSKRPWGGNKRKSRKTRKTRKTRRYRK